jgi:hypothetical protein
MSPIVIGEPEKPRPEERDGFYVSKNMTAYIDTTTDPTNINVDFVAKGGQKLFSKPFSNLHAAMTCINHMKEHFAE